MAGAVLKIFLTAIKYSLFFKNISLLLSGLIYLMSFSRGRPSLSLNDSPYFVRNYGTITIIISKYAGWLLHIHNPLSGLSFTRCLRTYAEYRNRAVGLHYGVVVGPTARICSEVTNLTWSASRDTSMYCCFNFSSRTPFRKR